MIAGLLAADERGAGRSVLGSGKGTVLCAELGAEADLEVPGGGDRDDRGGHVALLRGHQRRHWGSGIPPSRLRHPLRPLQPHLSPAEAERRLLDQRRHRLFFLSRRLVRLRRRRPPDSPRRQVLSPIRRGLSIAVDRLLNSQYSVPGILIFIPLPFFLHQSPQGEEEQFNHEDGILSVPPPWLVLPNRTSSSSVRRPPPWS